MTTDPTNPKDAIGATKLPLRLFPVTAIAEGALALLDGAGKYGQQNFRATPVRASIYIDAALRHLYKYAEGENADAESGLSHLGHALASLAILIDAKATGTLIDDRLYDGAGSLDALRGAQAAVPDILERHRGRDVHHYTIQDSSTR